MQKIASAIIQARTGSTRLLKKMIKKKHIICIIPARGGSKGIQNKNIINFMGKPLLTYSINYAKKSNYAST